MDKIIITLMTLLLSYPLSAKDTYIGLGMGIQDGLNGGKDAIVDFKTSSKPKKKEWIQDYFIQATAYSLMFEYVTTYHIPNIVICMAVENNEPIVFEDTIYPYVPQLLSKVEEYHAHFEDETIAHQIANAGA